MSATCPPEGRLGSCLTNIRPISGSRASNHPIFAVGALYRAGERLTALLVLNWNHMLPSRSSAYFTSILSGVNVSCNAESNVLRRADNQPNPCGTRLTTDYLHRRSDKKAYPLSQDRVAMGKCALSPTKRQRIFPRRQRISHQNRPRCFPVIRYWREAPQHDAGTERYLTRFLMRRE